MPNLRGASPVGRDEGGRLHVGNAVGGSELRRSRRGIVEVSP